MLTLLIMLACGAAPDAIAPVAAPQPPPASVAATPATNTPADAPPPGRIGGDPILDRPVVLGAISPEDVDAGIAAAMPAIQACYDQRAPQGLRGKVLVRFSIDASGAVTRAATKATSLRHADIETCVNAQVSAATFTPPQRGTALVSYPFSFPTG